MVFNRYARPDRRLTPDRTTRQRGGIMPGKKLVPMVKDTCRIDAPAEAVGGFKKAGWKEVPAEAPKTAAAGAKKTGAKK